MNTQPSHTLRQLWTQDLQPDARTELRPNTLRLIETTLRHWTEATHDPPLVRIDSDTVRTYRDWLLQRVAPATAQKHWRHISKLFRIAFDCGLIHERPAPSAWTRANILPKHLRHVRRPPRDPITLDELAALWTATAAARYPAGGSAAADWKRALYLLWLYGMRTLDAFQLPPAVTDDAGKTIPTFGPELLTFRARKTSKLQALPLTDFGRDFLKHRFHFSKPGCWNHRRNAWENGFGAAWNRDILPAASCAPTTGPTPAARGNALPGFKYAHIRLKDFRSTAITAYNSAGRTGRRLGAWIAGHSLQDVDERHYDRPTDEIRNAVTEREQTALFIFAR